MWAVHDSGYDTHDNDGNHRWYDFDNDGDNDNTNDNDVAVGHHDAW